MSENLSAAAFMLGYLDDDHWVDAVRNHNINPHILLPLAIELNEAFGCLKGVIQYLNIADRSPIQAERFAQTRTPSPTDTCREVWHFENDDEYVEWLVSPEEYPLVGGTDSAGATIDARSRLIQMTHLWENDPAYMDGLLYPPHCWEEREI